MTKHISFANLSNVLDYHTCKIAHDSENIATTVSCEVYSESFYGITKYKVSEFYWKFCALVEECNSH